MNSHYNTLGVVITAEPIVIKAAYRALAAMYHPDKNDSPEAGEKIKAINVAYEILSDPQKRKEYDASIVKNGFTTPSEFDNPSVPNDTQLEKAWSIANQFHPEISSHHADLGEISWRLAFAFKLKLLEEQSFTKSQEIAEQLKREYLSRFFGQNHYIQKLAESLIKAREIPAAIYLNEIINVMGSSASTIAINEQIYRRYPDLAKSRLGKEAMDLYEVIKKAFNSHNYYDAYVSAKSLVTILGGTITHGGLFGGKIFLELDGERLVFYDRSKFVAHVIKICE